MYRAESLNVQGHPMPTLVFEPTGAGPHPGLVIAQHLPVAHAGLEKDPFTIDVGERYAAAGYVCVIPFLFHWWPEDEDIAVKREAFRDDWTVADLDAAYTLLTGMPTVAPDRIGILGHCWGGRVAWLGACHNAHYKACVVFYGGRIKIAFADGAPPPLTLANRIPCPVLGIFGNEDTGPSPADVNDYEAALQQAAVPYTFHRYDGAGHGFQDFYNPERYCKGQSEDAWGKAIAFLDRHLK
ncbi:MAG: dienelactone hydrolase family protein [Candidatus Tectimicrobiota bacterium]